MPDNYDKILTDKFTDYLDQEKTLTYLNALFGKNKTYSQSVPEPFEQGFFGIWKINNTGEWIRDEKYYDTFSCWAEQKIIPKKSSRIKRVVFIGESAARGYLFDPVICPAKILEYYLKQIHSIGEIEVIDLARIDITLNDLSIMLKHVQQFEPDYLICFAGNNWHQLETLSSKDLIILSSIFSETGITGIREYIKTQCILPKIYQILYQLKTYTEISCYPIFVIPEFNLKDWQHDKYCPDIPALENRNPSKLFERANSLIDKKGKVNTVKTAYIESKDAVFGLPVRHSPRCFTFMQEFLKIQCQILKLDYIDLPTILAKQTYDTIPGNNVFIDYCHLNLAGMEIMTESIITQIILNEKSEFSITNFVKFPFNEYDKDIAGSYFLAAIHHAHYGQPKENVKYWLQQAINTDSYISDILKNYLTILTSIIQMPMWLYKEFETVSKYSATIQKYLLPKDPNSSDGLLEQVLICAIQSVLNIEKQYHFLQNPKKPIILTDPRYWANSRASKRNFDLRNPTFHYQVVNCKNIFYIPQIKGDYQLTIVLRSKCFMNQKVKIFFNDILKAEILLREKWSTNIINLNIENFSTTLTFIWPDNLENANHANLQQMERLLSLGKVPQILPILGEMHLSMNKLQLFNQED